MASQRVSLCLLMLFAIALVEGCFWTTCQRGGKRNAPTKACMRCGPKNGGECAGPHICCYKGGCVVGGRAKACAKENHSNIPCVPKGIPCGAKGKGRCTADGICCSTFGCETDSKCGTVYKIFY